MAHYNLDQALGQFVLDSSGNNYGLVNGSTLNVDDRDVIWTDRGAYLTGGRSMTVAPESIHQYGLTLSIDFTLNIWAMPNNLDKLLLIYKATLMNIMVSGPEIGGDYHGNNIDFSFAASPFTSTWFLYTIRQDYTSSSQTLWLISNGETKVYDTYHVTWTDHRENELVIGRNIANSYFTGFIYSFTIYDGLVPLNDFVDGSMFNVLTDCLAPAGQYECLSICSDPNHNQNCESCQCDPKISCRLQTTDCIVCDSQCSLYCDTSSCLSLASLCSPHVLDVATQSCDWDLFCPKNCHQCEGLHTCLLCNDGFYLDANLNCLECHSDCSSCDGPSNSNCQSCSDISKMLTGTECICRDGYFQNSSSSCEKCHEKCSKCDGGLENNCSECAGNNHILVSRSCVCDSGFYENPLDNLECLSCTEGCGTCTGPLVEDCLDCTANQTFVNGSCECEVGFFVSSISPLECLECHRDCSECSGSSSSDCTVCSGLNQHTDAPGLCVCDIGFYLVSENPLVCEECDLSCASCSGPSSSDCISCLGLNQHFDQNQCVCDLGYYSVSSSTLDCQKCPDHCPNCTGPSDCDDCSGLNQHTNSQGICSCDSGYFEVSSSPLVCSKCSSECSECSGPSYADCLSCTDPNSTPIDGNCVCNQGYFSVSTSDSSSSQCKECPLGCSTCLDESTCTDCPLPNTYFFIEKCVCESGFLETSSEPLMCEACPSKCAECEEGKCLECIDPIGDTENKCECKEGFYWNTDEEMCLMCQNECESCSGGGREDCISCKDDKKEKTEKGCECKTEYCEDEEGNCVDCLADVISEFSRTGTASSGAVTGGIFIGLISMITLDDPTVLWTITSIAQIISYLPLLEVPLSDTAYEFMLSYKTCVFLPNIFLDIFPKSSSKPPFTYQKFGKHIEEYQDTQFLRNGGRFIFLLLLVAIAYFLMFLVSFVICKESWKTKLREKSGFWISMCLKVWLQILLDVVVAVSVNLFELSYETSAISMMSSILVGSLCVLSPLFLVLILSKEREIREKNENVMKFVSDIFSYLNLESKYGIYYEFYASVRKLTYGTSLYLWHSHPSIVLIAQMLFSFLFILYICKCRVFLKRKSDYINILAEIVLLLSFMALLFQFYIDEITNLEFAVMGMNIVFILGISVLNIAFVFVSYLGRIREKARNKTHVINSPSVEMSSCVDNSHIDLNRDSPTKPKKYSNYLEPDAHDFANRKHNWEFFARQENIPY